MHEPSESLDAAKAIKSQVNCKGIYSLIHDAVRFVGPTQTACFFINIW